MAKIQKKSKSKKTITKSPFFNYWDKTNYLILAAGFLILVIGFILLGQEPYDGPVSLTVSPILLITAYFVIIPIAIFYRKKINQDEEKNDAS